MARLAIPRLGLLLLLATLCLPAQQTVQMGGFNLRRMVEETKADVLINQGCTMRLLSPAPPDRSLLDELYCDADLVVIATVVRQRGELSTDESYVQTFLEVRVDEVLKQPEQYLPSSKSLIVKRRGGTVKIGEYSATYADENHLPLATGSKYIFLLKNLDGRTYEARDCFSALLLNAGRVAKTTKESGGLWRTGNSQPEDEFFAQLRKSGAKCTVPKSRR